MTVADEPLLRIGGVTKRFGGFVALDAVSIDIQQGERFGLIGPNGSGKTTLINCITGVLRPEGGIVAFEGTDISSWPAWRRARGGIARTFQIPRPFVGISVTENLRVPLDYVAGEGLSAEDVRAKLVANGIDIQGGTAQDFAGYIKAEVAKWAKVTKDAGIEPE